MSTSVYLPSVKEIELRSKLTRLMTLNEWDAAVVTQIMIYDQPTPNKVVSMISYHGIEEAYRRLQLFVDEMMKEELEQMENG